MYQVPDSITDDDSSDLVERSIPMLTVDFRVQKTYESTKGYPFRMFLVILLVTFLSVMYLEMKSIISVMKWTWLFPRDNDAGLDGQVVGRRAVQIVVDGDKDKGDSDTSEEARTPHHFEAVSKAIFATRMDHRIVVGLMTLCRLLLWVFLLWSGVMFLTGEPRYLTLIFDALSLVFIFEIDEVLYKTMIRYELKQDHLSCDDMRVRHFSSSSSGRHTVLMDLLQFFGIIVFGMAIVYTYCTVEMDPLIDAIGCLCSKEGPRCHDAQHFSKAWWDQYWSTTMPAANLIIDQLKQAF